MVYLSTLKLVNWRNHLSASFSFTPKTNIVIGPNATGKTNILEGVIFLALTKSFRIKQDKFLISHNQDFAKIIGEYNHSDDSKKVEIRLINRDLKTKKEIYLDGPSVRAIDLIGQIPLVYFSPEEIEQFFSSPARRRRWLDIAISLTDYQYSYNSAVYRKVILNRNHLLKKIAKNQATENELTFWDNKWLQLSKYIIQARRDFIAKLSPEVGDNFCLLFKSENKLSINYQQTFAADNLEEGLSNLLVINRRAEIKYGNTITGPHREDIIINLDGQKINEVGSRGQMRLALLALKMSEATYLLAKKNTTPIVVLDDIFSELDQVNSQHVFDFIKSNQAIITATDLESLPAEFASANIIDLK